MKSLRSYILILVLLTPFLSSYLLMNYEIKKVKKEIKHRLKNELKPEDYISFAIARSQLHLLNWEHDKEFEFRGEMYDVVSTTSIGDSIHYTLWWDHEESSLHKKLNRLLNLAWGSSENSKRSKHSLVFSLLHFFVETMQFKNHIPLANASPNEIYLDLKASLPYINVEVPPPQS